MFDVVEAVSGLVDGLNENPVNWALLLAILYLVWVIITPSPTVEYPEPEPEKPLVIPVRNFTIEELKPYTGRNAMPEHNGRKPIYIACNGKVFDVSSSDFYGPDGPYAVFAGRDASRGLATMSLNPPSDEWDDISDLGDEERTIMVDWEVKFSSKYPIRGRLVKSHEAAAAEAQSTSNSTTTAEAEGLRKRAV